MNEHDYDELYEGLQVDDDLVVKAVLRVGARPLRNAVAQSLAEDLNAKFKSRMHAMLTDIEVALEEDDTPTMYKSEILFGAHGALLIKAGGAQPPNLPPTPRMQGSNAQKQKPKTVMPNGERKLTADGYIHVENAGSRGGKFWRDDKGNVRYGERPHGHFNIAASPEHIVEHFRQYYSPTPFGPHTQPEMREALAESEVLSEGDRAFMQWYHDNYDVILGALGTNRKAVEKAKGLENLSFTMSDGRSVGWQEAIEEFFRANVGCFVGDPVYGDIESPEDILKAVRALMERYRTALHEDPKVQAAAAAIAQRADTERSAYFIRAEQMEQEFSPLAGDLVKIEDANDLAARFTVAMFQMGLVERGGKGKVAQKRMRGAIVPKSRLLDEGVHGSLHGNEQLDRLSASQLMALHIASDMGDSFAEDNTYDYAPGMKNSLRDNAFQLLAGKLGIGDDDVAKRTLQRKLQSVAQATASAFTAYNTAQDPHFAELFKLKTKDVAGSTDNQYEEYKKIAAKKQAEIEGILKAQEDETFEPPPSMQNGIWNGKTLRDPKNPDKGVWAPFKYQAKYINWMLKAKRGIIAADAGMGKTPTVIAFRELLAHQGKDVPAICFLPPSLMEQWPGAVAKFAPDNADKILNLSGLSLEERKVALQSDMAKKARYIFISTGTLVGEAGDPNADESENDGTGGSDHEMVQILKNLEGAVFIDECHQGGYKKAGNTRHEIAKQVMEGREYAFGMTATPIPNDAMDIFHLSNLFAPGAAGDDELWAGRMAGATWNAEKNSYDVANPEHIADLNKRLKPWVFYKSINDPDVVADMGQAMPEKQGMHENHEMWKDEGDLEISHHVNSENGLSQNDYFKKGGVIDTMVDLRMRRLIRERMEKAGRGDINPETGEPYKPYGEKMLTLMAGGMQVMLQRQASISPALIDPSYRKQDGGVAHTPKIKALCDDIIAHFSNGGQGGDDAKPLVVFCSFPGKAFPIVRKALADRGVDPSLIEQISGEVAPHQRGYMQDKLNKGHSKVLLVGTLSGGAGLNLQEAANKTLFLDEPWNPAAKRQATGRVWRTGQKNTVFEKTYRTMGSYDSAVEQKIAGKQALAHALLSKDLPTSQTFNTDESVASIVGRTRGTRFDEAQIKAIMENSSKYDLSSHDQKQAERLLSDMGVDWEETLAAGGKGGAGAHYTDKDYEPNAKAQDTLKNKGAHALTKKFDETEFRGKWALDREKRMSKQNFEMANLMADVYRQKGDKGKAEEYESHADKLAEKYPDLGGTERTKAKGEAKAKAGADKKKDAKSEAKPKGDKEGDNKKKEKKAAPEIPITATVDAAEKKVKGTATKPKKQDSDEEEPKAKKTSTGSNDTRTYASHADTKSAMAYEASQAADEADAGSKKDAHENALAAHQQAAKTHRSEGSKFNMMNAEEHDKAAAKHKDALGKIAAKLKAPVVKENKPLGVAFHTKDNPFNAESNRKVKGTNISQAEASWLVDQMHSSKAKSWDDFITKIVKPAWNDENGRKPFSMDAAHDYIGQIVDAVQSAGVATVDVNGISGAETEKPEAKKTEKKK